MREIGGRVAIVTGASRGLGRHIAEALFDHGVKLIVTARDAEQLESVRASFDRRGTRSVAVPGDITDPTHRRRLVEAAQSRFGALDILVNNAGNDHPEPFIEVSLDDVRAMFELNVIALIDMTQTALRPMLVQGEGQVVNMASMAGLAPVPYASIYAATKHAIVGFSESLRYELEDAGIGVSVVCPSFVRDAGLFHDNSAGETSGVATVSPTEVADAVLKAITANKGRVIVSPPLVKLTPLLEGISPHLVARAARLTGSYDAMKAVAERLKEEAKPPTPQTRSAPAARRPRPRTQS
jgi:short-subunit dehydrogenase